LWACEGWRRRGVSTTRSVKVGRIERRTLIRAVCARRHGGERRGWWSRDMATVMQGTVRNGMKGSVVIVSTCGAGPSETTNDRAARTRARAPFVLGRCRGANDAGMRRRAGEEEVTASVASVAQIQIRIRLCESQVVIGGEGGRDGANEGEDRGRVHFRAGTRATSSYCSGTGGPPGARYCAFVKSKRKRKKEKKRETHTRRTHTHVKHARYSQTRPLLSSPHFLPHPFLRFGLLPSTSLPNTTINVRTVQPRKTSLPLQSYVLAHKVLLYELSYSPRPRLSLKVLLSWHYPTWHARSCWRHNRPHPSGGSGWHRSFRRLPLGPGKRMRQTRRRQAPFAERGAQWRGRRGR
jgi:hypothetical protein